MRNIMLRSLLTACVAVASQSAVADILAVSWPGNSYDISSSTGSGTLLGASGFTSLNSMAEHNGVFYSVSTSRLLDVDPSSGIATEIVALSLTGGATPSIRGLAVHSSGRMYAANDEGGDDILYSIDIASGIGTLIGAMGHTAMQGLGFDANDRLYAWAVGSGGDRGLHTVNLATGLATDVNAAVGDTAGIQAIDFAPDGTLYGARNSLFTINKSTGVPSLVGTGGYSDVRGIGVVPEPASLVALGIGLSALTLRRRRKA